MSNESTIADSDAPEDGNWQDFDFNRRKTRRGTQKRMGTRTPDEKIWFIDLLVDRTWVQRAEQTCNQTAVREPTKSKNVTPTAFEQDFKVKTFLHRFVFDTSKTARARQVFGNPPKGDQPKSIGLFIWRSCP